MKVALETRWMQDVALRAATLAASVGVNYPAEFAFNGIAIYHLGGFPINLEALLKASDSGRGWFANRCRQ